MVEGNCTPDEFGASASVEPGGGSTIVSYHEICQTHNIPGACQASSNYYHSISIQEVNNLIANKNCLQTTNTSNQKPTANANPCTGNVNIPKQTPFELTGSGSDSDGNNTLIFNWEQMDKAPARVVPWETAGLTTGPLFRSFLPSSTGNKRSFPGIANILVAKSDNCTSTGNISESQDPPASALLSGHNTSQAVTLTANDGNGNTKSCQYVLTAKNMTSPMLNCPAILRATRIPASVRPWSLIP